MDVLDNSILSAIFVGKLTNENVIEIVKKKNFLAEEYITSRIENLVKNGLVENDKKTLTDLGRTSLRVVLAGGVLILFILDIFIHLTQQNLWEMF